MKVHLGIDLGTTTTLGAFRLEDHSDSALHSVELRLSEPGGMRGSFPYLPSVATLQGGEVAVGNLARNLDLPGQLTVRSVKRYMGTQNTYHYPGSDDVLAPEHISGYYLEVLRKEVLDQLVRMGIAPTAKAAEGLVQAATITVPAAFGGPERAATVAAGRLAGFQEVHLIDEPTAALLYYVATYSGPNGILSIGSEPTVVMVYDLGGGTLDVSVCEVSRPLMSESMEVRVLGRSPREDVGGDDVDLLIAAEVFGRCCQDWGWTDLADHPEEANEVAGSLLKMAEGLKVELSKLYEKAEAFNLDSAALRQRSVVVPEREVGQDLATPYGFRFKVERFEELLDLNGLNKADGPMHQKSFLRPLRQALADAEIPPDRISYVFLAGGGTRLKPVRQALLDYLGLPRERFFSLDPQSAVARGAALYSEMRGSGTLGNRLRFKDRLASGYYLADPFHVGRLRELVPQDAEPGFKNSLELVSPSFLQSVRLQFLHGQNAEAPEYLFPISWTAGDSVSPHLQLSRTWARAERAELEAELLEDQEVRITLRFPNGGEAYRLRLGGLDYGASPPPASYSLRY